MIEVLTIQEIKDDIVRRGWVLTTCSDGWGTWGATLHDLTIETEENLYLAPIVTRYGATEEDTIRAAYNRATEYFPDLPARYDEHGLEYKIKAVQND